MVVTPPGNEIEGILQQFKDEVFVNLPDDKVELDRKVGHQGTRERNG